MAGGRNIHIQRQNDSDEETESSEEEEIEELLEDFEYRLRREQRKRDLQAELNRRRAAMRRFTADLNENWDDVMKHVPVSDSEDDSPKDGNKKKKTNIAADTVGIF